MNKKRILEVADAIERHAIKDLGFNMSTYMQTPLQRWAMPDRSGHDCGTVGCIAGWTLALTNGVATVKEMLGGRIHAKAAEALGLDRLTALELFLAPGMGCHYGQVTPEEAVRVLRHLAETGVVDWSPVRARINAADPHDD
jgi:hypothetical protein